MNECKRRVDRPRVVATERTEQTEHRDKRRLLLPSVHKTVVYTGQSTALQRDGWIDGRRGWLVTAGESEQKVMLSLLPLYWLVARLKVKRQNPTGQLYSTW